MNVQRYFSHVTRLGMVALGLSILCGLALFGVAASEPAATPAVVPQYDKNGALLRPVDFHTWTFVGSSIGLSYSKDQDPSGPGMFHNVYTQPEAYREFMRTGKFPEKTMFIIDMYDSAKNVSIAKHGYTEGDPMGIEVSVKDHEHFPEGWAYFAFGSAATAKALPKETCFSCHATHGQSDNVFTQYYPVLRK